MSERYFSKFNRINYGNTVAVNVTNRAVVLESVFENPFLYYDYDIGESIRPDQIADAYYEDQYLDWMVYIGNRIVDPYYGWYMDNQQLNTYVEKTYGPVDEQQQRVKYYENAWQGADDITESAFNALSDGEKKYWEAKFNNGILVGYRRVRVDWRVSTNRLVKYELDSAANAFSSDEILNITIAPGVTGKAQVSMTTGNTIVVQHVSGQYLPSNTNPLTANSVVEGRGGGSTATIVGALEIAVNIPQGEEQYWRAVTVYDAEVERNEKNREIKLVDNRYAKQMSKELTKLLRDT